MVWLDYQEPENEIIYYAQTAGDAAIRILGEDDLELRVMVDTAERGLNFVSYDLSITGDAADTMNETREEAVEAADNGNYYLPPGDYTVEITMGEAVVTTPLIVAERQ